MDKKYPYLLEVGLKAVPNKPEPLCVKCGNAYKNITYNKVEVIQTGSCLNVLSEKDFKQEYFDKKDLKWHPKPKLVNITNAEFFFSNKRASICPMTKCTLLKGDCKTKSTNKDVKMDLKWPYMFTTDQQSILGYNDSFCLECFVGDQKAISKPFNLTQTSKCLTTLKTSDTTFAKKFLKF